MQRYGQTVQQKEVYQKDRYPFYAWSTVYFLL